MYLRSLRHGRDDLIRKALKERRA